MVEITGETDVTISTKSATQITDRIIKLFRNEGIELSEKWTNLIVNALEEINIVETVTLDVELSDFKLRFISD